MLKIQVLGKGLIPRGYGLAPRTEPFSADLTLIGTILATPGLKVNMIRPEDEKAITLTAQNLKRMWETYTDAHLRAPRVTVPQTGPVVPASAINAPNAGNPHKVTAADVGLGQMGEPSKEKPIVVTPPATATPVVPEKPETPVVPEVKTDAPSEKKDEAAATDTKVENKPNDQKPGYVIKPINNDDKRNGNNNNNNNSK